MLLSIRLIQCTQSLYFDHWVGSYCLRRLFLHLVYLTYFICLSRSRPCGSHNFCTHGSFHLILAQLFFLFNCFFYCWYWFFCSCFWWCLLPSLSLGNHGIYFWSFCHCRIYIGFWPMLSLLLTMWSIYLHLCGCFLHHLLHLRCTSCTTRTFLALGPQFLGLILYPYANSRSQICTSLVLQW